MEDFGIRTLLDLHDQIIDQEDGYWLKIEAWEVKPTKGIPYQFKDVHQLLSDFFTEADAVLKEAKSK